MSLSVRTRFEVFKRDKFTCGYCGKHPPDVLLEVDHIVPRAAGGSDDMSNLVTACWECNSGKSDRLLEEGTAPTVARATVDSLRERLEQAAAYTELVGQQQALVEKQVQLIIDAWAKVFHAKVVESDKGSYYQLKAREQWPDERSISTFVRRMPVSEILAAIDIAASRAGQSDDYACRIFYKTCWMRIKGETGPVDAPAPSGSPSWRDAYELLQRKYDIVADRLAEEVGEMRSDIDWWVGQELDR